MQRYIKLLMILFALTVVLSGCGKRYNRDDFIGKTSSEIINEYNSFDYTSMPIDEDGLYRSCQCGYTIKEPKKGFLGTSDELLFLILFDENGIAIKCSEGNRPGG
ncbi:MAG: hypothetical protein IKM20_08545 [Erysipelotrichales bacterium]|nr:hypothetical protein [Erysipelotrichales bacterium]